MNKRCDALVCGQGTYGAFHQHQCHKKAVVERDGKAFCKIHDPVYKKEKYNKDCIKWEQEREKAREAHRLASSAPELLEALEGLMLTETEVKAFKPYFDKARAAIAKAKGAK